MVEELKYRLAQQLADALNAVDGSLAIHVGFDEGGELEFTLSERTRGPLYQPVLSVVCDEDSHWVVVRYT